MSAVRHFQHDLTDSTRTLTEIWRLRLYIAGQTAKSLVAMANLQRICEEHLANRFEIEVIDLLERPELAEDDKIIAIPTLVRRHPQPSLKIIGDLADSQKTLEGLQLSESLSFHAEGEAVLDAIRSGEVDAFIGEEGIVVHLNGAERPYVTFFNVMNEGGVTIDRHGSILHGNSRFAVMIGRPQEMLCGASLVDCFASADRSRVADLLASTAAAACEVSLNAFDGPLPVRLSLQKIATDLQQFSCLVITDLKENAQAKDALRLSHETLRTILETSIDGYWHLDAQGRLLDVNPAYCQQSGYTRDELLGLCITNLEAVESSGQTAAHVQRIIKNGSDRFESTHRRKDGSLWQVEVSTSYSDVAGGQFFGFLRDITSRKQAEAGLLEDQTQLIKLVVERELALRESEAFNLTILNSVTAEIAVLDAAGTILAVNEPWRRFAAENSTEGGNPAPNSFIGANYLAASCQDDTPLSPDALDANAGIRAVLDARLPSFSQEYACHSPGQQRWFSMIVTPLGQDARKGVVITHTDITQLKQAEEKTRQLLVENETILRNAMVGIVYVIQRCVVSCNRRFEELFLYAPGELVGASTELLCDSHENFLAFGERAYGGLRNTGNYSEEVLFRRKDGSPFWGLLHGSAIDPGHPEAGVIWICADISVRRRAELESGKLLRAVEQSPISIVITDRNGVIEYVNPNFSRVTGYTRDEAVGQTSRMLKTEHTSLATHQELWHTILDGRIWRGILRNRCKNGDQIWEEMSIAPIFGAAGEITNFVAVKENVTERKQLETQLEEHQAHLEDQVLQRTAELSEALEAAKIADRAKDAFLANITHELRTPLAAVIGFSSLARPFCTDVRQREYLDKVNSAGKTLASIIDDLLDLSKIVAGRMEFDINPFSLRQLVARSGSFISFKAEEKGLALVERIDPEIPDVLLGDSLRLEQILLNLLSNAVKFTTAGHVELRIGLHAREERRICLDIAVEDTGIGLREDEIALLFKPFSQADSSVTRKFGGTGLGLAICKHLAELMDGDISVTSRADQGTTFHVMLWLGLGNPAELPSAEESGQESAQIRYQDARVLVVDDQPFNRDVVAGLLAVVGIAPELASNGQEAIDILADAADGFDLVLMDIQMPVMDGLTATRVIRKLEGFAQLPIIAMTAHTMVHELEKATAAGLNDHIGKPFDEGNFYRLIAKWIPPGKQQPLIVGTAHPARTHNLPPLSGVDTRAGLALLLGNEARYRQALSDFIAEAPLALNKILDALATGEREPASMAAHILKGRTGLLGMKELHGAAGALEAAIDGGQPTAALLQALQQGIAAMCMEIQCGLGPASNAAPLATPLPEKLPSGLPPAAVARLIARLEAGDSDCDILVTDGLMELEDTPWAPHLRQAQSFIRIFDFAAAISLLVGDRQAPDMESVHGKTDPADR